jgi:hypothetical protein
MIFSITEWAGTSLRLQQPEQDIHQRGLAGAVLPEDRVNLARFYLEIDPIVGDDPRKPFCDPPRRQDRLSALYPFQEPFWHVSLLLGPLHQKSSIF